MESPAAAQVVVVEEGNRQVVEAPQTFEGLSGSHCAMQTRMPGTVFSTPPAM